MGCGLVETFSPPLGEQKFWQDFGHLLGTDARKLSVVGIELQVVNEDNSLLQEVTPYLSQALRKNVSQDASVYRYGSEFRIRPERELNPFDGVFDLADTEKVSLSTQLTAKQTTSLLYVLNLPFPKQPMHPIELQANGLSHTLAGSALNYFCKAFHAQLMTDLTRVSLQRSLPRRGLTLVSQQVLDQC